MDVNPRVDEAKKYERVGRDAGVTRHLKPIEKQSQHRKEKEILNANSSRQTRATAALMRRQKAVGSSGRLRGHTKERERRNGAVAGPTRRPAQGFI
jgi:hypothetical protein